MEKYNKDAESTILVPFDMFLFVDNSTASKEGNEEKRRRRKIKRRRGKGKRKTKRPRTPFDGFISPCMVFCAGEKKQFHHGTPGWFSAAAYVSGRDSPA